MGQRHRYRRYPRDAADGEDDCEAALDDAEAPGHDGQGARAR